MRNDYNRASWAERKHSIAMAWHWKYGRQIWTKCKMRKLHKCSVTGKTIEKGDTAFRPITNSNNRSDRITFDGIEELIV